jgi:hypothetical protein
MKRFLINSIIFVILICSLAFGLSVLSDFIVRQREYQLLTINQDINKIFAGDSNVEGAINDSIIENSINIAQSGEAYFYSYIKIKSLLEFNNQIDTIFIGFSLWDLLNSTEERWLFSDEFMVEKITSYNYLLHRGEKPLLIKRNPIAYSRGLLKSIVSNFTVFMKSFHPGNFRGKIINFGGYEYSTRDRLEEDSKRNPFKEQVFKEGEFQKEYLLKISQLCHQKSIKLVLLNTPKHSFYNSNIDQTIKQNWLLTRDILSGDSLLDFSAFILPDSCFGDLTHLNYMGANIFSRYLNERLH